VSADGRWGATALPGATSQSILLWRTDKQPIPAAILSQVDYVTTLNGVDKDGDALPATACIFTLGGQTASGKSISSNQRYLLPDSLMFVRDGLIFLMEKHLDYVFGISLVDGHLSAKDVDDRTALSVAQGTSSLSTSPIDGQYVPDADIVRGLHQQPNSSVQFSFTGNAPAADEEGPDKVAFIAGDNEGLLSFHETSSSWAVLSSDVARRGYAQSGNRNKSLLFLETSTGATGLDLAASTLKDLSGDSSLVYGDLLPPGRPGEELDFMAVSPDGDYVAVVRDQRAGSGRSSSTFDYEPTFASITTSSTSTFYQASDDLLVFSTTGEDLDSATGTQTVLFVGSGNITPGFSGTPSANSIDYASARAHLNSKGRRVNGVTFSSDGETVLFRYAGDNTYWTKYYGTSRAYTINSYPNQSTTFGGLSSQISLRLHLKDPSSGGTINFASPSSIMKNNLEGLGGITKLGDTSAPFTDTDNRDSGGSKQQFWANFRSADGNFLYHVVDQIDERNYLVGMNVSGGPIAGHDPYEPFILHGDTIGFQQFETNAWNYESRFAAAPAGVVYPPSGRDGSGIVFIIGSDPAGGAESATDLEVYAFDSNVGGDLMVLTSDVTDGTSNAINHLYVSADGNFLVGQRAKVSSDAGSGAGRAPLNGDADLFAVTNVHDVLDGAQPQAFIVSGGMSHGSSVAFVGENTATGPQALVYSSASKGDNKTWVDRTLKIGLLAPGASPQEIDGTKSHYFVLGGSRVLGDVPTDGN
jgi:hypothetical protein